GIDVDRLKEKLYSAISKTKTVHAAVSSERHAAPVNIYKFHKFWSECDTISRDAAVKLGRPYSIDTFQTIHIDDFLDIAERPINFLNIDIEGLDVAVLMAIDFSKYRPQ